MSGPRAFVVGHPIAQSRSPLLHGFWLERYGIAGRYERLDVAPRDFPAFLRGLRDAGWAGGNVTVPHKEAAFAALDVATERARRLGAANTLWFEGEALHGDNTDGLGFTEGLAAELGPGWARGIREAVVIGAGGAARAVVPALLDAGVPRVAVVNRDAERARTLALSAGEGAVALPWSGLAGALAGADLLVNATSLGMRGQSPLPVDLGPLSAGAVVADIVYVPIETPLLREARRRGLRAVDGLGMLLHQAVPGFARWFGRVPAVGPELRARLLADIERAP